MTGALKAREAIVAKMIDLPEENFIMFSSCVWIWFSILIAQSQFLDGLFSPNDSNFVLFLYVSN